MSTKRQSSRSKAEHSAHDGPGGYVKCVPFNKDILAVKYLDPWKRLDKAGR